MEATAPVQDLYTVETGCRSCGSEAVTSVIEFGETPLADRLLTDATLHEPEPIVPLTLGFCRDCGLAQIRETVDPEVLFFDEYPYFSSVSPSLLEHFRESALNLIETRDLDADSFVLEAGSNDGYMLRNFVEHDIPVLGIDPAEEPAQVAQEKGIETRCTFFTEERARELRNEGLQTDLFLANNVLAHVPDLNGFVEGIRIALKPDGVAVIEVPYVVDLVDHGEFDTIYHQHLCYFSVTALDRLFRRHDLYLNDVERTSIHGGSLRLYVEPHENVQSSVRNLRGMERGRGVDRVGFYRSFGKRVAQIKRDLRGLLDRLRAGENRIVGYGAAAKATTLLHYCDITADDLDYIVDLNEYKHGRYMGGSHIPIHPTERLLDDQPDYALLLAWNFADEIMEQQSEFVRRGGRFILPLPTPKIVGD
ncbi:MAG: methyltransferase domain-containing protein [Salinibacter sp.]|uniref:methyltransferase domain-containing protein n=1 Tax=Salinibacter sp. TaxID=2065818 RepID=UPI0035D4B4F3